MQRIFGLIAAFALVLAASVGAMAQQSPDPGAFVQQFDQGSIDWQQGQAVATGIGAPPPNAVNMAQARAMAVRAATVVARRNLLEIIKGVQIDSQTTVQNYMVSSDVVVNQVRGFLQNSQILDTAYMSDGSVEVTVGIPLRGGFANVILPDEMPFGRNTPKAPEEPVAVPASPEAYTGLLIDARGLGVRPAMSPTVLDANGEELYGSSFVSRDYAVQQGMAGYAKDKSLAMQNPRIASNPVVVAADKATGRNKTDLVVPASQAAKVRQIAAQNNFLEQCKVMILVD